MAADDSFKIWLLARARLGQGRTAEAIQLLAKARNRDLIGLGLLGYAYARSGRREEAERLAAAHPDLADRQALIFAGLRDKDRAFAALDRMSILGAQRVGMYLNYPELALLRGDPRLKALRKNVGLPE